jgi:hypothetical protein
LLILVMTIGVGDGVGVGVGVAVDVAGRAVHILPMLGTLTQSARRFNCSRLHWGIVVPGRAPSGEQSRSRFGVNIGGVVGGVGASGGRTLHTVPIRGNSLQTPGRSVGPHWGIVVPTAPPGEQLLSVVVDFGTMLAGQFAGVGT